jgi:hypothetical protein
MSGITFAIIMGGSILISVILVIIKSSLGDE